MQFDNRYQVSLPWKPGGGDTLLNNERLARKRLHNLGKRLDSETDLKREYNDALKSMETSGVIEEVPRDEVSYYPIYYMPHRPVVKESSMTTKVRPVFDASAPGYNGISLNDCLETGPNLLPNLVEILVRFRRWLIGLSADITKAFLQIKVQRSDQDVHRFLWDCDGTIRTMRFVRLPFVNRSSPFLLNATIQYHLGLEPSCRVVEELKDNFYVDDCLTGADDVSGASDMIHLSTDIMRKASMVLTKWCSNDRDISEVLSRNFNDQQIGETHKVLGLKWLADQDCFSFDGPSIGPDVKVTKRLVLSVFSRMFDPMGLLTPYTMVVKILFQQLWELGIGWDEAIPENFRKPFGEWLMRMNDVKSWLVPRSYTGQAWCNNVTLTVHGFGDASPKAYGACVYLVVHLKDGTKQSSLVMSKARVAPLKSKQKMTLPRLELMGSLLCARLVKFVVNALKLPDETPVTCWTDSTVCLGWIQGQPIKWKPFVSHRVGEIQNLTHIGVWNHCPGNENPSDMVTRGVSAKDLVNSLLWLKGPTFLTSGEYPAQPDYLDSSSRIVVESEYKSNVSMVTVQAPVFSVLPVERWSSLDKAIRVTGWILRFLQPHTERESGEFQYCKLTKAKFKLFLCIQRSSFSNEIKRLEEGHSVFRNSSIAKLSPFLDDVGLLRVGGRLQQTLLSYEEKHPLIIPKSHFGLLLVRFQHVLMKHTGVGSL